MSVNKKLFLCLAISLLAILIVYFVKVKKETIVFVENAKVFSEFNMSIEMKKIGDQEINSRSKVVDSLYGLIQIQEDSHAKEMLVKEFAIQKEALENYSANFASQESNKIWARIKTYVKDFSEEEGYELILGMQPNENILYGAPAKDVSDDFIKYINKKYEGNK